LAARYGALDFNPIRDVDTIESESKRKARALTDEERDAWFEQLRADRGAVAADLPDLSTFMLATGVRIGESLAVLGHQVDFVASEVEITRTAGPAGGTLTDRQRDATRSRQSAAERSAGGWAVPGRHGGEA
jgi:integrase